MRTTLYLLRHAESLPSDDVAEPDWPLSPRGQSQARALCPILSKLGISAIYSSPYPRALETVRPFAELRGKPVQRVDALAERGLTSERLSAQQWTAALARCWSEPRFAWPGGESNWDCRQRVAESVGRLVTAHQGERVLIASHGNALALFMGTLDSGFGYEAWRALRNPDLYRVEYQGSQAIAPAKRVAFDPA